MAPSADAPPLKILIVEDVSSDAELVERELRRQGLVFTAKRVETRENFLRHLEEFIPDIILSDYMLPSFDGMAALRLTLERAPMIPVIILTGSMNEVTAVECMKAGATDYVIKEHLTRLGMAVRHALAQKTVMEERNLAEKALRESEQRYRLLAENAQDMIFRFRLLPTRGYEYMSPASVKIIGYTPEEFYADPGLSLRIVHPEDHRKLEEVLTGRRKFEDPLVQRWRHRDDRIVWIEQRNFPILDPRDEVIAIEGIARDITERQEAERQLRHSREMLRNLSSHLQTTLEEERAAIAREIHDELGQSLTALKMDIAWINPLRDVEALGQKKKSMIELVDHTISTVQHITAELRPSILDDFGLAAAIEWQVEEFQKRTGIACELSLGVLVHNPDRDRQTAMFRILQESLTNIMRHAEASKVSVRLAEEGGLFILTVGDNGRGFSVDARKNAKSFGLMGMEERTHPFNGDFRIITGPREGTIIIARITTGEGGAEA